MMGSGSNVISDGSCCRDGDSLGREFCFNIVCDVAFNNDSRQHSAAYKTLHRLVNDLLAHNDVSFNQMIHQLSVTSLYGHEGRKALYSIADMMLQDGELNWGRIAALFAFTAYVAKHCYEKDGGTEEQVNEVARNLADYVDENLSARIRSSLGGWESITERFPEKQNIERLVWKGLLGTVVGLGLCSIAIIASK